MNGEFIVALIAALGSAFGSLAGILVSAKLTNYRLEQLEKRVSEHNHFAQRVPVIEEQIRTMGCRITNLEDVH